ncbi:secreted frizzled-related protein 4-like [Clytia hemisphaerica]|uniref:FZ domain-containing protein n=2 Tax=Clytia hemisphaerica TaxID=252671 RepID=A0A7M5WU12_9CNID
MYTLLVAGIFLTTLTTAYEANRKCEPNRAALCKNLYNSTRFPNFVKHRSQVDAIIELNQYKQLIDIECAPHLRLFLCSVLMPMCTMLEENILPCRSLCEESKAGCETVLLNFVGLPWPDRLKCDQFPVSGSGQVCVENKNAQPNKKTWVDPNKRSKMTEKEKAILICSKGQKIRFRKIVHENKNCKRHISQETIRKKCDGEHTCEFTLKDLTNERGQGKGCRPGKIGSASIKYQCYKDKPPKQIHLKYRQDAFLLCKSANRRINILKVQYRDEKAADTCITPNAFCSVTQSCTGKQNCALYSDNSFIPSPCKNLKPKLIVDYECEKTLPDEKVVQDFWENIELKCPAGKLLNIVRAEYIGSLCSSKNIHCAVNLYCKKKQNCILKNSDQRAVQCKDERSKVSIRYACT